MAYCLPDAASAIDPNRPRVDRRDAVDAELEPAATRVTAPTERRVDGVSVDESRRRARERGSELDASRLLVRGDPVAAVLDDLLGGRFRAGAKNDHRLD